MGNNTIGYTESENFRCLEDLQEYRFTEWGNGLQLDYCGMERCRPDHSFGPYVRHNFVIHVVIDGKGTLEVEGRSYEIRKNQAFLLWPGDESIYQADTEEPWVYAWIGFHGLQCERVVTGMGFRKGWLDVVDVNDAVMLTGYISRMLDHREMTFENCLRRGAFLELMVADMMEYADVPVQEDPESDEAYVKMAVTEILAHYEHPLKIAGIARKIGINRSYLSSLFKNRMGVSPQQFLVNYRMEKSAELLTQTGMSIRTIAAAVGYTDPLTFSKAFKQRYGVSPSAYRAQPPELLKVDAKGEYSGTQDL